MPIDLSALGGFLPHFGADTGSKGNESPAAGDSSGSQSWFSGLIPGSASGHWPGLGGAGSGDSKGNTPQQSSIDWLFGHISDAAHVMTAATPPAAAPQADAAANRAAARGANTEMIQQDNPDLNWKQVDRRMHGGMIGNEYMDKKDIKLADPKGKIGNLESEEDRNKFLSSLTQVDPKDPKSMHYCGPTALMAAAIHADGAKGLGPMVASMQASLAQDIKNSPNNKTNAKQAADLAAIQERIAKGELNNKDIKSIQEGLYGQLKKQQDNEKTFGSNWEDPAITQTTMKNYLSKNEYARKMLKDGNSNLSLIDNDGDYQRNHWVLRMGDADGKNKSVYDPQNRKGGQIIRDPDQVDDYEKTNATDLDETGEPVARTTPETQDQNPGPKPS